MVPRTLAAAVEALWPAAWAILANATARQVSSKKLARLYVDRIRFPLVAHASGHAPGLSVAKKHGGSSKQAIHTLLSWHTKVEGERISFVNTFRDKGCNDHLHAANAHRRIVNEASPDTFPPETTSVIVHVEFS